jgi:hypothetical protein
MSMTDQLRPGQYTFGTASGWVRLHTFKEGLLQRMGHDLVLNAESFSISVTIREEEPHALSLTVGAQGLNVVEPRDVSAKDRAEINRNIVKHLPGPPSFEGTLSFAEETKGLAEGQASVGKGSAYVQFPFVLDGTEAKGQVTLSHKALSLAPFRAPLGVIRLQDRVVLSFCIDVHEMFETTDA